MRFCVERNLLTDSTGKAIPLKHPNRVSYVFVEATNAAEAILSLARQEGGEVVQRVHRIADLQAMATFRYGMRAVMMHAFPEEEAEWRRGRDGDESRVAVNDLSEEAPTRR